MLATQASERELTGACEMSRRHGLSGGNSGQPTMLTGPLGWLGTGSGSRLVRTGTGGLTGCGLVRAEGTELGAAVVELGAAELTTAASVAGRVPDVRLALPDLPPAQLASATVPAASRAAVTRVPTRMPTSIPALVGGTAGFLRAVA
jgi:hypothetical protein